MAASLGGGRALDAGRWSAASPDERVVALAVVQHGVVSRGQALRCGLDDAAIAHRVRRGRLRRLHAGVLAVGPIAAGDDERCAAGLLAAGGEAVLGLADAGARWRLAGVRADPSVVEVVVDARRVVRRPAVSAHRTGPVHGAERRCTGGLAVTSPARTLVDLAQRLGPERLEVAVADARRRHLVRDAELAATLARAGNRAGTAMVRDLLRREGGPAFTRSDPERRLVGGLREAGVDGFETNASLLGYEIDLLWRDERLAIEVDAYGTHGDPRAFEADRARDAEVVAAGFRVLRVTRRQLLDDLPGVVARVERVLGLTARA